MRYLGLFMLIFFVQIELKSQFDQESIPETTESYKFKKINLDAKVGIAFPVGGFADSDILSDESGYAKPGTSIGLELNAKPTEIVGFGVDVSAVFNNFNTSPYDVLAERDTLFDGIDSKDYLNVKMLTTFTIGVASENVEAELKLMVGPMFSKLPEQTLNYDFVSTNIRDTRSESNSIALCAGLGFSSRYYFDSFYLKTFADYTSAKVIHDVSYSITGAGVYTTESLTYKMSWMTIGAGVGVRF